MGRGWVTETRDRDITEICKGKEMLKLIITEDKQVLVWG